MTQQSGSPSGPDWGQLGLDIMGLIVVALVISGSVLATPHLHNTPSAQTAALPDKQSGRGKSHYVRGAGALSSQDLATFQFLRGMDVSGQRART